MDTVDTLIVGAGAVGLAIAAKISQQTHDVLIIDKNSSFGEETSSRNSEVIHAGIYYPKDTLKASLCVKGKQQLYQYCKQRNIPFNQIGKLLIASSPEEEAFLEDTLVKAKRNGVNDLLRVSKYDLQELEPNVRAFSALLSPSTGIIDSHAYMLSLLAEVESSGSTFSAYTRFIRAEKIINGFVVWVENQGEEFQFTCKNLVNSSGLHADDVANKIDVITRGKVPKIHFCRGHYFSYSGPSPFRKLIYPIPSSNGLGIHATLDLAGQVKFGPDTEFINSINYSVSDNLLTNFAEKIRQYFPAIDINKLQPAYAGIRPKLFKDQMNDFIIQGENEHGVRGLINLFGIESPGLTASLSIADYVSYKLNT